MDARLMIDSLFDDWEAWDVAPSRVRASGDRAYLDALEQATASSGSGESIVTGCGRISGIPVAVIASDFDFLAGSIGADAAARIIAAAERATAARLPIVALPRSGGTRMQEGTDAFVLMVAITSAIAEHRAAGLPLAVYLRHPTTGGVMASWGSLGHVTWAEPGALVGFLGPRVFEALHGEKFPAGVQTAENLAARGVIDAVLTGDELRRALGSFLRAITVDTAGATDDSGTGAAGPVPGTDVFPLGTVYGTDAAGPDAWASILATRDPGRPGVRDVITALATDVTELSGTGAGETDPAVVLAVCRIAGHPAVVVGHDRSAKSAMGPWGLRVARRGYALAAQLGLPLVTFIDTEGAELSAEAENGAMAGEIARSLADLVRHPGPVLSVLLGSGCGGGALALMPADRVLAAASSWVTPLPPEGAAVLVHRDASRAPEVARAQRVRATDLLAEGIVDRIVAEPVDPRLDSGPFLATLGRAIAEELSALVADPDRAAKRRRTPRPNPAAGA